MKRLICACALAIAMGAALTIPSHAFDPAQERLGVRMGYVATSGKLKSNFGDGYNLTLFFSERLAHQWFANIKIGQIFLADLSNPEIAERLTAVQGLSSDMRFSFLTIGPEFIFPFRDTWAISLNASPGIYSVSMYFDSGIQAFNVSDQHFGMHAGAGMLIPFFGDVHFELNVATHKIFTSNDAGAIYWEYTQNDRSPFLFQFGAGLTLELR